MKRTLDNGGNDRQLAQYSNSGNYIINNQQDNIATLINTRNFSQIVLELKKNPEYVYKSILDYGVIDNNSQYMLCAKHTSPLKKNLRQAY